MRHGDDAARVALLSRIGEAASRAGLGRTTAQLYAALLMSEEPLSLDDLAAALGMSKASVSTYVRVLAGLGAVRKVWTPGMRRDRYEAEGDILKVMRTWAQVGIARRVEETGLVLAEAERFVARAERRRRAPMTRVRERIAAAKALHGKLGSMLAMLPALLGRADGGRG